MNMKIWKTLTTGEPSRRMLAPTGFELVKGKHFHCKQQNDYTSRSDSRR
jgi:hypothetical protein